MANRHQKGYGRDRSPLISLEPACGIEPTINLLTIRMGIRDNYLIMQ